LGGEFVAEFGLEGEGGDAGEEEAEDEEGGIEADAAEGVGRHGGIVAG
jgi:hypothetical protein